MPTLSFTLDGAAVDVETDPTDTLLAVLRERLGVRSVKDGCAPQGQCGCCTVLVDGSPRVACVTPASRVRGRAVQTVAGVDGADELAAALVATGGTQCGFCTPGIVVRLAAKRPSDRIAADRALAAHLCRCTGWQTVLEALDAPVTDPDRDLDAAAARAALEGGVEQRVGADVARGATGFADDTAPADAWVAVPRPPESDAESVEAAGETWVVGPTLPAARATAAKTQGRRTTLEARPPLPAPPAPSGGVALATSWVEPAYLEPDASWCAPGGEPASPLANGGAFGAKASSLAPGAARALADRLGRPVRVVYSREDVVRLGPKRPPIAATALVDGDRVRIDGTVVLTPTDRDAWNAAQPSFVEPLDLDEHWNPVTVPGPPTSPAIRAAGLAERAVLVHGALDAAGRSLVASDDRLAALRGTVVGVPSGAFAGVEIETDETGAIVAVDVDVVAGDPLDAVVLRSYAIGAVHAALGWVQREAIAVDPGSGAVLDLTIRSFGILRPAEMPPVRVRVHADPGPARARASDAVFAATAAAAWIAGGRGPSFPLPGAPRGKLTA